MKDTCRPVALILAALVAASLACSAAQQRTAASVLHFTSDACRAIAEAKGRADIAAACGVAHDGSEVLQKALDAQPDAVCAMPDAGSGEAGDQ